MPARYSLSTFGQIWTWLYFIVVFLIAWNVASLKAIERYDEQTGATPIVRRPFVVVIGVYAYALAVLYIAMGTVVTYCIALLLCLCASYAPKFVEAMIRSTMQPSTMFTCIAIEHIKFHALLIGATVVAVALLTWLYVSDEDLRDPEKLRHRIIRMLIALPGSVLFVAYVAYAIYSTFSVHDLIRKKKG